MRTNRRGLTVIELVLILLAIGLIAFFAFRYLGRDDAPADADSALATPSAVTAPGDALAERLSLVAPLDSTAPAGDTVAVRVRATTGSGTAIANVTVAFEVASGGGSVAPPSAATNDLGEVEARWVLGADAGPQELRAAVAGRAEVSLPITITAVAAAAGADGAGGAR